MIAKLVLPRNLQGHALFRAFDEFFAGNAVQPERVHVDFSRVNFVKPPSVAFLSNLSHWLVNIGVEVTYVGMNLNVDAIRYLDDSGFFEQHTGSRLWANGQCRPTTMPLKQLSKRDSHSWLENSFIPWLSEKSGLSRVSLAEVKTCLQELINNISDHTDFDEGCVFGQWYPNINEIVVSVADFGVGIPKNVARIASDLDDSQAIKKAAEDGFSSKSLPTNRGAGLYLLLLNVVIRFNGKVTIRSGKGYVEFVNRDGSLYTSIQPLCGYCIGTTIDIVLNTENIPQIEVEEEDFEW